MGRGGGGARGRRRRASQQAAARARTGILQSPVASSSSWPPGVASAPGGARKRRLMPAAPAAVAAAYCAAGERRAAREEWTRARWSQLGSSAGRRASACARATHALLVQPADGAEAVGHCAVQNEHALRAVQAANGRYAAGQAGLERVRKPCGHCGRVGHPLCRVVLCARAGDTFFFQFSKKKNHAFTRSRQQESGCVRPAMQPPVTAAVLDAVVRSCA